MTQGVLLFFSCEPGGAEVLIPAIKLVEKETHYKVFVLGYGLGAERFAKKGVQCIAIEPVEKGDQALLDVYHPNLIITSATSLPERDMSEKHLWHNARRAGIPTMAFLDQWQNYAVRFSGVAGSERLAYLPDYINCINEIGRSDMTNEGIDGHRLLQFGQPYLSSLAQTAAKVDEGKVRQLLGIEPAQSLALFASEAIQEHYGRSRGYDQYDALKLFMELMSRSAGKIRPLVKLHPKDAPEGYERILNEYAALKPVIVRNEVSPVECLQVVDEVYGMSSIMLIEAFALGKKAVSIQPGLRVMDPMVLSRLGYIQRITSTTPVAQRERKPSPPPAFAFEFSFRERAFLNFIEETLKAKV
ncbi:MAG TPA: hypothetical protein VK149_03835 [Sideroxyarcus sp.]|nr:hypothetical protein [Sideroxyarcus sp.]